MSPAPGAQDLHKQLEAAISAFHGTQVQTGGVCVMPARDVVADMACS
jgi:hypothetical protein